MQMFVRDALTADEMSRLGFTPTAAVEKATLYVQPVGKGRFKLLVVVEDGNGNATLKGWRFIPAVQEGE